MDTKTLNEQKKKKKKTYTQKLLFTRKAERIASFTRLILLVVVGAGLFSVILKLFEDQSVLNIVLFLILGFIEIGLWFSQNFLDKVRKENDFEIDSFEETAKYRKKRVRPEGQIDENGEMNVNVLLKRGSDFPMEDLNGLIGLATVKKEVEDLKKVLEYEKKANISPEQNVCRHYAFLGNPGTGKTTVSRIFAGLLYENGRIKKNKYLECTGNDLTGEYPGQTKLKVNAMYQRAQGGVWFIDEAYALCSSGGTMADEAISQLLVLMESDPYTVIIFAGYTNEMLNFLALNPGLASRVSRKIEFSDYNAKELLQIFTKFCNDRNLSVSESAKTALINAFTEKIDTNQTFDFSNGRYARNCFDYVYQQHAINSADSNSDNTNMMLITEKDVLDIYDFLITLT